MIGILLNDRYRIQSEIGRGGMGTVYRAEDQLLERPVAVKVVGFEEPFGQDLGGIEGQRAAGFQEAERGRRIFTEPPRTGAFPRATCAPLQTCWSRPSTGIAVSSGKLTTP